MSALRLQIAVDRVVALVALCVAVGLLTKIVELETMVWSVRWPAICASGISFGAALSLLWRRSAWLGSLVFVVAAGFAFELVVAHEDRIYSELMIGAAVVAGWAMGAMTARFAAIDGRKRHVQEAAASQGAIGAMAALWTLAAISKLLDGGLAWIGPGTVWHVVLAHVDVSAVEEQRSLLIEALLQPQIATGLAAFVLATELSAPMLLWRGRPRQVVTIALALVHVGLSFVGMLHVPLALMILAIGLAPTAPQISWKSRQAWVRTGALCIVFVILAWVLPIDRWMAVSSHRRSKAWQISGASTEMMHTTYGHQR